MTTASFVEQFQAMGSPFSIRIDLRERDTAPLSPSNVHKLFSYIRAETESMEQCLSRFRSYSELTELNCQLGKWVRVSKCLADVLRSADSMYRLTAGVFDPRVLVILENIGYHGAALTSSETALWQVNSTSSQSRMKNSKENLMVWSASNVVQINHPIDLGGIGKGYAADVLATLIEQNLNAQELSGYIVDAGGDLVLSGEQESGAHWSIGVDNPFSPGQLMAAIEIPSRQSRTAVCTSSDWRKSWRINGHRVHHLIDPATGAPANTDLRSVTAIFDHAATAEVFTKYVFLRGLPVRNPWSGHSVPCLYVDDHRVLSFTRAMESYLTWISPELSTMSAAQVRLPNQPKPSS